MTVVEVVVTSAILLAVLAVVLGLLASLTTQEARTQALVTNEQEVRFVLNDFARDVRGADPLTIWADVDDYRLKLQMQTRRSSGAQFVRWVYDPAALTLTRQIVADASANASVVSSQVRLRRVRNDERGIPMLEYFGATASDDDDELVEDNVAPAQVANCSVRVRMTITADSQPGPEPFTESVDVHLRNRLPGGIGCPI